MSRFFILLLLISSYSHAKLPAGIAWHSGSVESAFQQSKKENKPLFLYWGAVWCPPCNQIKKNIFSTSQFKSEIKKFIAVYLDGDTKEAQTWGDKLKTAGYPTMIIIGANGEELVRISSGTDLPTFISLMKKSGNQKMSFAEVVETVGKQDLSSTQFELLANHSWGQDDDSIATEKRPDFFYKLYQMAPLNDEKLKSKFFMNYMQSLVDNQKTLIKKEEDILYAHKILNDQALVLYNLEAFAYYGKGIFDLLFGQEEQKNKAKTNLIQLVKNVVLKNKNNVENKLLAYELIVGLNGPCNPELKHEILTFIQDNFKKIKGDIPRQALIGRGIELLVSIELFEEATKMALAEIERSKYPYYYLSDLAYIAKKKGDKVASVQWSKKAYLAATGDNTKFRWGLMWINSSYELQPQLVDQNQSNFLTVLTNAKNNQEMFNGGNGKRLNRLAKLLKTWSKDHPAEFKKLVEALQDFCPQTAQLKECHQWVGSL